MGIRIIKSFKTRFIFCNCYNGFKRNIDIINYIESLFNIIDSTIHQHNESFHFIAWKNLDKNSKNPYYQRADEIHARLVEEVLYDREKIVISQSISQLDCIKSNKDIKKSIKIKLQKFNALILSNNELFNISNVTQDTSRKKLTS